MLTTNGSKAEQQPQASSQLISSTATTTANSKHAAAVVDYDKLHNQLQNQSTSSFNSSSTDVTRINEEYHTYQLNEKVTTLATSIYQELEKIIKEFGRDTVKELMPIVVNILEALDLAYQEKEELKVENELLKDDNEQLLNQYEREKQFRKDCEQKQFQLEDTLSEQKKEYEEKLQSLESIVRMIELKSKNASDHVARLEEKEVEMKREYTKLHERYTELFKTHCDYMDRNKILYGANGDDSNNTGDYSEGENNNRKSTSSMFGRKQQQQKQPTDRGMKSALSSDMINQLANSNRNEISSVITNLLQEIEQQNVDTKTENGEANAAESSNDAENAVMNQNQEDCFTNNVLTSAENFDEHITEFDATTAMRDIEEEDEVYSKNDLSLFNELSRENYDPSELDDGADLSGMTREVANLIRENTELLQTKHALNVLKDDLIAKLDNFSSEMIILREEIKSLQTVKACLQLRISELEEESKKSRDELAEKSKRAEEEDESIPLSQRKRFTRAEMARVLMERNQYKERLMDLQEAVRWIEYMRATKADPTLSMQKQQQQINESHEKKKSPIWKFFSGLFGSKHQEQQQQQSSPTSSHDRTTQASASIEQVVPYSELNNNQVPEKVVKAYEFLHKENTIKRTPVAVEVEPAPQRRQPMNVVKDKCRIQAYGWSLPSTNEETHDGDKPASIKTDHSTGSLSIPVPIYCQPIFDNNKEHDLKPSCATVLNFSLDDTNNNSSKPLSLVWICSLSKNDTTVSILDPNNPKEQKEQFIFKSLKVLSVQSVTGTEKDQQLENSSSTTTDTQENTAAASYVNNLNDCQPISAKSSTIWFGTQEGWVLVNSAVDNATRTLDKVKLKDAVLSIVQSANLVIVGLADGSIVMFNRDETTNCWDLKSPKTVGLDTHHCSVRSLININASGLLWCGVGNKIYEIDPHRLETMAEIEAHPRKESQVGHMVCVGEGVWVSIRLDSTLRLFHAKTKQHLQYLEIEPFVTRMLGTSGLGLSLTRITSIVTASNYLWIGTGNGAIISIPMSHEKTSEAATSHALPYCNLNKAQFSFHGHRDAVRFFLSVAGKGVHKVQSAAPSNTTQLVLSGGQGYVDFRVSDPIECLDNDNDDNSHRSSSSKLDKSFLIVWQL